MKLLPPPPARVLDLGVGSGWTSEMLARFGYSVVGLDIAPDMIAIARRRITDSLDLRFEVCDYEPPTDLGTFDAVVIYDALHHAEDEQGVLANAFRGLKDGGVFISAEPASGTRPRRRRATSLPSSARQRKTCRTRGRPSCAGSRVRANPPVSAAEPAPAGERCDGGGTLRAMGALHRADRGDQERLDECGRRRQGCGSRSGSGRSRFGVTGYRESHGQAVRTRRPRPPAEARAHIRSARGEVRR